MSAYVVLDFETTILDNLSAAFIEIATVPATEALRQLVTETAKSLLKMITAF